MSDLNIDWEDVDNQIVEVEKSYEKKTFGKDDRLLTVNKVKKDAKTDSETYWMYYLPKFVKIRSLDGKKETLKAQKGVFATWQTRNHALWASSA